MNLNITNPYLLLAMIGCTPLVPNNSWPNTIQKNGMTVNWKHQGDRVFFEMSAPTNGWVAIGLNPDEGITGTYLLMGRVVNGKAELVEHYTIAPGNYQPIESLGGEIAVKDIDGEETGNSTTIRFSLPVETGSKYQTPLTQSLEYNMLIAFSRDDDFKHHSMMRTSISIKL
tara:strand:+ start:318 stop:830 length:513 start_codon:yes stop_codon:yes gene_type:complete